MGAKPAQQIRIPVSFPAPTRIFSTPQNRVPLPWTTHVDPLNWRRTHEAPSLHPLQSLRRRHSARPATRLAAHAWPHPNTHLARHAARRSPRPGSRASRDRHRPEELHRGQARHRDLQRLAPTSPPKPRPPSILQNEDDHVDGINQSLVYYIALKNAGVPAELHVYAQGGHAFGLRPTKLPATRWPQLVETWLATIGMSAAVAALFQDRIATTPGWPILCGFITKGGLPFLRCARDHYVTYLPALNSSNAEGTHPPHRYRRPPLHHHQLPPPHSHPEVPRSL